MDVSVIYKTDSRLGEGPVWDERAGELLWVDIEKCELHFFKPAVCEHKSITFDNRLGAAVPTDDGRYLLALHKGLAFFEPSTQEVSYFSNPEASLPDNRFNDGKCDPAGRFWIGSMNIHVKEKQGALYCIDSQLQVARKLDNLTISNGMAWRIDSKKMYFIDTATCTVVQYDYHLETGAISAPQIVIEVPEEHGFPDGMTVDREGMLWIAHWGGANVSRWNPDTGQLLQKVEIPALHVTSCCFGGRELDTLFITTARDGLSAEALERYPLSGSIFAIQPGVTGLKNNLFKTNSTF